VWCELEQIFFEEKILQRPNTIIIQVIDSNNTKE
jgi:hypothetical protein